MLDDEKDTHIAHFLHAYSNALQLLHCYGKIRHQHANEVSRISYLSANSITIKVLI